MGILKAFKNIIAYTVDKRFFVSLIRSDDSREIIVDAEVESGKELYIHRPVITRKDLSVEGEFKIGKDHKAITNYEGKILHSLLASENASDGQLLGFYAQRCMPVYPKETIFLSPLNPEDQVFNDLNYKVDVYENKTDRKNWIFSLPSYILKNSVRVQFFFLNPNKDPSNASFKYQLRMVDSPDGNFEELKIKIREGVIISEPIMTNIMTNNYNIQNNLCSLQLIRNKGMGSIDTFNNPLYIIGIKIEFECNFFSR